MTQQTQDPRAPFLRGTSLRTIPIPRAELPRKLIGGTSTLTLPPTGYGAFIRLRVSVRFTLAALARWVNPVEQAFSLMPNIRLYNNHGTNVVQASAFGLNMRAQMTRDNYAPEAAPFTNPTVQEFAAGTHILRFSIDIPLTPNLGRNIDYGLLALQSNQGRWDLEMQTQPLTAMLQGADGQPAQITDAEGYTDGTLYFLSVPDVGNFQPAPLMYGYMFHEDLIQSGMSTGTWAYELAPLGGTICRLGAQFIQKKADGTLAPFDRHIDDYDTDQDGAFIRNIQTVLDNTVTLSNTPIVEHDARALALYGQVPGKGGVVWHDALTALDEPGMFILPDFGRGFIDPDNYASCKVTADVNLNGAALHSVRVLKEYLQVIY